MINKKASRIRTIGQAISYLLLGFVIAVLPPTEAFSDEGHLHKGSESRVEQHEHQAPHGDKMAEMGSYHVEVVKDGGVIKVFLYDRENQAIPIKGISG